MLTSPLASFSFLSPARLLVGGGLVLAMAAQAQAPASAPAASAASPPRTASPPTAQAQLPGVSLSQLKWSGLTPAQQQALKPLQSDWRNIGPQRQRKWIEISNGYASMNPAQQQALQQRMTDWARLSPTERDNARLNFAEAQEATRNLTPEEKRARWEAYQALSPEEKHKLAQQQQRPAPKGAAVAAKTSNTGKLATTPAAKPASAAASAAANAKTPPVKPPRIVVSPDLVNRQTLLPQSAPGKPAAPAASQ